MVAEEYSVAYSEVLEILRHVPKEEYEKISKDKLDFYEKNKKQGYNFKYDVNKTLDEQGVSKIAKVIIATLYRDFWAPNEERISIIQMQDNIRSKLKDEMQIDFNPETMFKKSNIEEKSEEMLNVPALKEKSRLSKIWDKLKQILHIK
ncbi:MAG: hypothetical protein IJ809_06170 [Clostridia bacterium]|nr:hypothetical protein [Clostridia bacterium]